MNIKEVQHFINEVESMGFITNRNTLNDLEVINPINNEIVC